MPEISEINDSDIFIIADGNITHKITGENLILYIKNHDDISKYFVHQDVVDAANGVASLDGNQKLHSENIPFGIQSGSVYEGSSGKALEDALDSHLIDKDNPHSVTKAQINLGNVDNTADINKPVSHAQQAAIDASCTEAKTYTDTIVNNLIDGAPETMNTLNEIAEVFKEHQEVSDALNSAIGTKIDKTAFDTHVTDNNVHVTSSEKTNWNDSNTKKHIHSNKSVLDGITTALITAWNNAVTHISDNVKHVTSNERTLWNTVTDKVAKVDGKSLSSNDYSDSDRTKLQGIENGANKYQHPTSDGSKHIPANGTTNGGKYLKASPTAGNYEWGTLTKDDVEAALGYTPSESEGVTYRLSKSGSNIILTGSDGSRNSITDSDTTYTLSDFGITASSAEINHLKGTASNIQTQINNVYTKSETTTLLNDKLAKSGDGSNLTTAFTEASTLATINTGEKLSVIMGKVKKAITSLLSHISTEATSSILGHVKIDTTLSSSSTNPVQNKIINTALSGKLGTTGDGSNTTVAFAQSSSLSNLVTGEKQSALMSKIAKAVSTLISHVTTAATTSVLGHVKVDSALSSTSINPIQNKAVNTALAGKLATTGNASNTTVAYTEATALTDLASGEKQSVAFGKLKLAVKNVISIVKLLGTTDISAIGGGTVTGAISSLNSNLTADHWLPAPGYDLLAASQNTALQIYSANPNILAAQGVPEALSPYGLYICMGRSEYNTMLYIDVFGSIGAWSENTKKWMNYTPIHIQNKITYGTNVSLYHHNNCTLMHKVVHFSLGITVSETTGSNILTIAEGYRGGWSKSLIMTNAVSNDTYALHYYSDSGTVAAFRPVPAGRYLIVG